MFQFDTSILFVSTETIKFREIIILLQVKIRYITMSELSITDVFLNKTIICLYILYDYE